MSKAKTKLCFVGECRSLTAIRKGWSWKDGRLAAKPLFEALEAMDVDPADHTFVNLFVDPSIHAPQDVSRVDRLTARWLKHVSARLLIVALGQRVSRELTRLKIPHVALVHPAARGKIRKRHRYHKHVREALGPTLQATVGQRVHAEFLKPPQRTKRSRR